MDKLIERISSYNLFNYLLPGLVFAVLADQSTTLSFVRDNLFEALFMYYFIGLVISRVGSLIIEPILKRAKIVEFAEYSRYQKAAKNDEKIELLSEVNNTYRTLSSSFLLLLLLYAYDDILIEPKGEFILSQYMLALSLFILFIFAYRKQTAYISKRVGSG